MADLKHILEWVSEYIRLTPDVHNKLIRKQDTVTKQNTDLTQQVQNLESQVDLITQQNVKLTNSYETRLSKREEENLNLLKQRSDLETTVNSLTSQNAQLTSEEYILKNRVNELTQKIDYNNTVKTVLLAHNYLEHPEFFEDLGINISPELRSLALNYKRTAENTELTNERLSLSAKYVDERTEELNLLLKELSKVAITHSPIGTQIEELNITEFLLTHFENTRKVFDDLAEKNKIYAIAGDVSQFLGTSNLLEKTGLIPDALEELSTRGRLNRTIAVKNEQYWLKLSSIEKGIYRGKIYKRRKGIVNTMKDMIPSTPSTSIPQTYKP